VSGIDIRCHDCGAPGWVPTLHEHDVVLCGRCTVRGVSRWAAFGTLVGHDDVAVLWLSGGEADPAGADPLLDRLMSPHRN
jgi:hypothetical protein